MAINNLPSADGTQNPWKDEVRPKINEVIDEVNTHKPVDTELTEGSDNAARSGDVKAAISLPNIFLDEATLLNEVEFGRIVLDMRLSGHEDSVDSYEFGSFRNSETSAQITINKKEGEVLTAVVNFYMESTQSGVEQLTIPEFNNSGYQLDILISWDELHSVGNKYSYKKLNTKKLIDNGFDMLAYRAGKQNVPISIVGGDYLAIGDSITFYDNYQQIVSNYFNLSSTTHAKGGASLIHMVDGVDSLPPLSVSDVSGKSLITLFGGFNDRSYPEGSVGDLYPSQNTICGRLNYSIKKVLQLLIDANNQNCAFVCILPYLCGKYEWIDADGLDIYPTGGTQTLYTATRLMKKVCEINGIPTIDLFTDIGWNQYTWSKYTLNELSTNEYTYIGEFATVEDLPVGTLNNAARVVGVNNAYIFTTLWELSTSPFPWNSDQLHPNSEGHNKIANHIIAKIKSLVS